MNVSKILDFNLPQKINNNSGNGYNYQTNYGLKMASPLKRDTVSFGIKAASNKNMGRLQDMISNDLAERISKTYQPVHKRILRIINKNFGNILSDNNEKGLITLNSRLKKNFSIRQKSTSIDFCDFENIMREMKDISGIEFILEEGKSFQQFCSIISKMVKNKEIKITDMEYYRIPPLVRRGKPLETYDSLNVNLIEKLGATVDEAQKNRKPILDIKPSPSGYSGLHITIQNKDGTFSEWQIMTRAMHNFKQVENFFYKIKEGKSIDKKYSYIEDVLAPLKPIDEETATQKEKQAHKNLMTKIRLYTLEAYKRCLKRPYEDIKEFLKPYDPEIEKYDFNKILKLKELCESINN